jgi:hypothetical protein
MKIISLQAENFKKLVAVEIKPDGNFVQITGKNGQGKTSTLDAIWVALAGMSAAPSQPIRKGATAARIRLDLGEVIVTRHFKAGIDETFTTQLTVESAQGARYPSPQKMLDSLLGALSFDPLAFSRMEAKDQFNALTKFVPDVDFAAIDAANKREYDARTDVNRKAKEARSAADSIKITSEPKASVDESELVEKMRQAGEHNTGIEKRKANREKIADQIADGKKRIQAIHQQISEWQKQIDVAEQSIKDESNLVGAFETKLADAPPLPDPVDTAVLADLINDAREVNATHARWVEQSKQRKMLLETAESFATQSGVLTKSIEDRTTAKLAKIAAAKLPIEGIGFGDGMVLLNDLPFDQASDAEKLRASVAIAMAANPKLPVVLIRDGSLLDEDGLRMVAEMADTRGAQVWIERVSNAGGVGIVLENGSVKIPTLTATNAGGTGLEQSPSDHGDGRGDSALTPGAAGGGRAPGDAIEDDAEPTI